MTTMMERVEAQADTQGAITAALNRGAAAKEKALEALKLAKDTQAMLNDLSVGVAKLRGMSDQKDADIMARLDTFNGCIAALGRQDAEARDQLVELATATGALTDRAKVTEEALAYLQQANEQHAATLQSLTDATSNLAATIADPLKLLAPEVLKAMQHVRDVETILVGSLNDLMAATRRRQVAAQETMALKLERAKFQKRLADETARVEAQAPQDGKNEAIRKQQMTAHLLADPELQVLQVEGDILDERLVAAEYELQCANDDIAMFHMIAEGSRTQVEGHSAMMQVFVTAAHLSI